MGKQAAASMLQFRTIPLWGKDIEFLDMVFSQGLLYLLLRMKARTLTSQEKSQFLRFATEVKKYYGKTQLDPGISFRQILDFKKLSRKDIWQELSEKESTQMYEIADSLDRDEWYP